jgi:TolB-like protein/DNA-binding winged helix-turn-helix (wHTH) protein/Tfp pilus assembly protein PilF
MGRNVTLLHHIDPEDFRLGDWFVQPRLGRISSDGRVRRLEPKVMALLVALAGDAGILVSKERLIDEVWQVEAVAEGTLSHAIGELRSALEDDAKNPKFIETIYGRGYRLLITPEWTDKRTPPPVSKATTSDSAGVGNARQRLVTVLTTRRNFATVAAVVLLIMATTLMLRNWYPGLPKPMIRSLAVLPLADLTGNHNQAIFVDGMHEALIGELASIHAISVTSRTSVLQYRDTTATIPEIAVDLGVDAVIEGSVMRDGNRVSVTIQLIDGRSDRHLWHGTFERDLHNVLRLRSEVARAIADEIRVTLTPQEEAALAAAPTVNPEAYDLFLRGRHHTAQLTHENVARAIDNFQKAIDIDPSFAPAWGGLSSATCARNTWIGGNEEPALVIPVAERAARRALALDPTQVDAQIALAYIAGYYYWQWDEAEGWFRSALDTDPTLVMGRILFANFLIWMDRCAEAEPIAHEAVRLAPFSPIATNELAWVNLRQGNISEGERLATRALDIDPDFPQSRMLYARFLVEIGRIDEGLAMAEGLVDERPGDTDALFFAARAFAAADREERTLLILADLEERSHSKYISPGMLFELNLLVGELERALDFLERAYEVRDPWMIRLDMKAPNPAFDPIRRHPRFRVVMENMAFPPKR